MTAITADKLLTAFGVVEQPLLLLDDGRIVEVTTTAATPAPPATLHLPGTTLAPGFLDIHVHGAGGHDVMEGPAGVRGTAAMLARFGTTDFLATTVTTTIDRTLRGLEGIADSIEAAPGDGGARPLGIHLEGPFLSHAKRGVHPPDELQPPSIALFERFREAARGHINLMTIAPELPGATDLIAHVSALGIRCSMGHSDALATEAREGIGAGAVSATHTFNAMRALDHREPGILGVVLDDERLYAELICDGVHTTPEAVRLWWRMKGEWKAVLVSDGMAATGMPDGRYKLGSLDVDVQDGVCTSGGVLAGSVLTLDRAVDNLQRFTGASLPAAVRLATRNPARLLGLDDERTRPGADASFTLFRADGSFAGTVVRGTLLR